MIDDVLSNIDANLDAPALLPPNRALGSVTVRISETQTRLARWLRERHGLPRKSLGANPLALEPGWLGQ